MLDEMRTFVLLAEEGSIQKVAERLPLTQPAVTRQIQRLEQELGVALLDRRLKPSGLTPAGVEALACCREILAAYAGMKNRMGRSEPEGRLRLGVANGLADDGLARIVKDLRRRFPRVSILLTTGWSDDLAERFRRGWLDAAILLSGEAAADGPGPLGHERLAVIASSRSVAKGRGLSDDLGRQAWILSPEPCDARRRLAVEVARHGGRLDLAAEVQDARLQLALVKEGVGWSLMPRRLLARTRPAGIVEVEVKGLDLVLTVTVQRSPYLQGMAKVVDAIVAGVRASLSD
ncbi:LysR family transcriptional regulator [Geothrix terrae]|uniref:LysR family transcriptional regulator n=1 Tax=Geothrix terrae TaxID=2922720 RepID=UPI001FAB6806|nr:LysR family transcriptional regulator [Geothrix terrae]